MATWLDLPLLVINRGIDYIQVPTTLLAQVDSSVGGKTAVNHPSAKNMIGAFHQPRCVIAEYGHAHTLPEREFAAGIAEIVKYGLIYDPAFFVVARSERRGSAEAGRQRRHLRRAPLL